MSLHLSFRDLCYLHGLLPESSVLRFKIEQHLDQVPTYLLPLVHGSPDTDIHLDSPDQARARLLQLALPEADLSHRLVYVVGKAAAFDSLYFTINRDLVDSVETARNEAMTFRLKNGTKVQFHRDNHHTANRVRGYRPTHIIYLV